MFLSGKVAGLEETFVLVGKHSSSNGDGAMDIVMVSSPGLLRLGNLRVEIHQTRLDYDRYCGVLANRDWLSGNGGTNSVNAKIF